MNNDKPNKSLWREIHDGTAGAAVRVAVSLAAALFFAGLAFAMAYFISYLFPGRSRTTPRTIYVRDETMAVAFLIAGFLYLIVLHYIWSRYQRKKAVWTGAIKTIGTWLLVIPAVIVIEEVFGGDEEILISAVVFIALTITCLIWIQVFRHLQFGRALYANDGQLDLRCPRCDYRMVGLKESRCPECGQQYTIDQLMAKQNFDALRTKINSRNKTE
ncbi:MAG: hypothetical protein JSV03_05070 [Planctomycetota bacterium]|nr:MAG: hypothetical protein JSV03_05070 [Planctomycetota bacterium]